MYSADRMAVLLSQDGIWGDDEVKYWLETTVDQISHDVSLHVLDPLVVTSMVLNQQYDGLQPMVSELVDLTTIITAVAIEGHWIPIVWKIENQQLRCLTGGFTGATPAGAMDLGPGRGCHAPNGIVVDSSWGPSG